MLTRWMDWSDFDRTFNAFEELRRNFERLSRDYQEGSAPPGFASSSGEAWGTFPRAAVQDNGADVTVRLALPGLTDKDVQLSVNQDVLTISGERKADAPEGYTVHRKERGSFKFSRSFALEAKIDPEKVSATLKDGVLNVVLTKAAESQPRTIAVKSN